MSNGQDVADLKAKLDEQHAELIAAIDANHAQVAKKLAEPASSTFVGGVAGVGGVIGGAIGGVAAGVGGTVADAVGVVGSTADALHNAVDSFFSGIRARLGI